jgi:catalase
MSTTTSNPPQDSPELAHSGIWRRTTSRELVFDADEELVTNQVPRSERSVPETLRMFERLGSIDIHFVADDEPGEHESCGLFDDDSPRPSPGFSRRLFAHIHAQLDQMAGRAPAHDPLEQPGVWSYRERDVAELRALSSFAAGLGEVEPAERRRLLRNHLTTLESGDDAQVHERASQLVDESYSIDQGSGLDDLYPPFLGMLAKTPPNLKGRKVGVLVSSGTPSDLLEALGRQLMRAGARMAIVAPRSARVRDDRGQVVPVSYELSATPCVLFDAVAVIASSSGAEELARDRCARDWVFNAFHHCRVLGYSAGAAPLLVRSGIDDLRDLMLLTGEHDASLFVKLAVASRSWERDGHAEPSRSGSKEREVPPPPPSRPARWAS